jgi:hypothetical protein
MTVSRHKIAHADGWIARAGLGTIAVDGQSIFVGETPPFPFVAGL